jgi:hypothetical protein
LDDKSPTGLVPFFDNVRAVPGFLMLYLIRSFNAELSRMIWMINPEMKVPVFSDRIEKKYQMEIDEANVASLWRELVSFLAPYGLAPVKNRLRWKRLFR